MRAAHAQATQGQARQPFLLGHGVENFEIAVSDVCVPFLLDDAPRDAWTTPPRMGFHPWPSRGLFEGLSAYRVGGGGEVVAGVGDRRGSRECTIEAGRGDPQAYLAALRQQLSQLPFPMASGGYQYPRNAYAERILLCAPADGPHLSILISVGPRNDGRRGPAILASFLLQDDRNERCDGVPPPTL